MDDGTHNLESTRRGLLRELIPEKTLQQLSSPSDFEGFKQLAYHVGCMLLSTWLIYKALYTQSSLLIWSAMTLHGFFLSFLFMGLHECVHNTAFKSVWLNKAVGWWYGLLSGRLPMYYTFFHFPHHRFTGDTSKDPELMDTLIDPSMTSLKTYIFYLTGIPFWIAKIETAIRLTLGNVTEPWIRLPSSKQSVVWEQRYFLAIYFTIALLEFKYKTGFVWYYWLIPSLLGQPFLRFYLISEHVGCQTGENMLNNTRTTETYWWYRRLAWNMPYHAEHHAYPAVPFYQLGEVHKLISARAASVDGCTPKGTRGYFNIHQEMIQGFLTANNEKSRES